MEALGVTGPARNVIAFAPHADIHVATFERIRAAAAHTAGVYAFASACRSAGINVTVIPERFAFDPAVLRRVDSLIEDIAPQIVQTHNLKSHFLMALVRRRCPWIAFHHGYTATDAKMLAYNQIDRWSLPRADRVLTTCHAFVADLTRRGVDRSRIGVLHNAVRVPRLVNRRHLYGAADPRGIVLSVGRLSREKGHDTLVDACARLNESGDAVLLHLVGAGPERARLARMAVRDPPSVRLHGHVVDVQPFYQECDVFVLPSRSEGSPNALLEAMASACPIVATAVGGVPEIVEDGRTALLVPPDNPAALASAVRRLLHDDVFARRLGRAAREAARDFTPEARAAGLTRFYAQLLDACAS